MALADDLKRIDLKDMANWPAAFQLMVLCIITIAVVALGYFVAWSGQFEELEAGRTREDELKNQFLDKKQRAVNLEAYKQQLAEIKQTFEVLLKQLPRKSEMEALLTEVNQSGVGRGLQFDLFKPGTENKTSEMAELPIQIKLSGTYHDLAAFASDVSKLSRIVTINDLLLKNITGPNAGGVQMEAVAKTYRYLDEEEKAEVRQAERKGGSK